MPPVQFFWLKQDTRIFIVRTRVLSSSASTLFYLTLTFNFAWRRIKSERKKTSLWIKNKIHSHERQRQRNKTKNKLFTRKKNSLTLKTKICSSTKSNSRLLQLDHVLSGQAIFVCIYVTVMAFANSSTLYLCLVKHPNDVDLCNSVYRVLVGIWLRFLIETNDCQAEGVEQYNFFFFLLVLLPMGFRPIAWKWWKIGF